MLDGMLSVSNSGLGRSCGDDYNYCIVVYVDDIFAVGEKARCDPFGKDLNQMVPVKHLGVFRRYTYRYNNFDFALGILKTRVSIFPPYFCLIGCLEAY